MSKQFWWLLLGLGVVVLVFLAAWFFWPRPIRSAGEMPTSPQEKAQRWQRAMEKAFKEIPKSPVK